MNDWRNLLHQFALVAFTNVVESSGLLKLLNALYVQPYGDEIGVQRQYLRVACLYKLGSPALIVVSGKCTFLQRHRNADLLPEYVLRQRLRLAGLKALFVSTEVFKVSAIVKDEEPSLCRVFAVDLIDAGELLAETSTTPDHLPEFRL